MGDRTVSKIVHAVSTAILDTIQPLYLPQPTTEMWETIASRFEERWQFPHCIGALDGKHINTFAASYLNTQGLNNSCLTPSPDAKAKGGRGQQASRGHRLR